MRRGAMTVFLSLVLTLILSLVFTVVEGARMSAIRMKFTCAADIGMNSVLAEYHRELLKQYDLLFVDMSYGGTHPSAANTEAHLQRYLQNNFSGTTYTGLAGQRDFLAMDAGDVAITAYSLASDQEGEVLKRQVTDYMNDYPQWAVFGKLTGWMDSIGQLESRDIAGERAGYQAEIDSIGLPTQEVEEGVFEEVPLNNPADVANATRSIGVLNLVLDDVSSVSRTKVNLQEYLSYRDCLQGSGVCKEAESLTGAADEMLFMAYLFQKYGYYGKEKEQGLLKYQLEYIVAGQDTDWVNLEKVAKKLLLWREIANVIYILSDSAKIAEAEAMAAALAAVTLQPALLVPVKYTILFAWAYVESLMDVRRLLKGGRVPIFKTAQDWQTGINSILDVKGSMTGGEEEGSGLSSRDYLAVMVFLQDQGTRTKRAMDVIEMDIRQTPGNANFRLDGCFDTYTAHMEVESRFGYTYEMTRQYGFY